MSDLKLLDLAGLIADAERLPGKMMPTLLRRLRMLDAKGLIPVSREEVGRREGLVGLNGALRARLFSVLMDNGFDAETLRKVVAMLNDRPSGSAIYSDMILSAVRAGVSVDLVITLWHNRETGAKFHGISAPSVAPPLSDRAKSALDNHHAAVAAQAVTTVPLNDLFAPILAHFEA